MPCTQIDLPLNLQQNSAPALPAAINSTMLPTAGGSIYSIYYTEPSSLREAPHQRPKLEGLTFKQQAANPSGSRASTGGVAAGTAQVVVTTSCYHG